jgi:hypothetical protein
MPGTALLIGLVLGQTALAADPIASGDFASGSTGRANPRSLSAIATSPGVIALDRQYTIGGSARFGPQKTRAFQAGASDSVTGPIALGLMWAGEWATPPIPDDELPGWRVPDDDTENPTEQTTIAGAIGGAVAQRRLGLGIGVSYHRYKSFYREAQGVVDLSAGLSGKLGDQVIVAAAVRDFLPSADFTKAPLTIEGGLRWGPSPWFGFEADVWSDLETLDAPAVSVGVGGVAWAAKTVPIRLGYTHDGVLDQDRLTAGVGAGSEKGSLEYAFGLPLGGIEDNSGALGTWHGVSLIAHF